MNSHIDLSSFGLTEYFRAQLKDLELPGIVPGRVLSIQGPALEVMTASGIRPALLAGKLKHDASSAIELPVVGDWITLRDPPGATQAQVLGVLERRSCLKRRAAGARSDAQLLAANIDTVFITQSLNDDFNLNRLDRYLIAVWDSGARPVVLLTKADLVEDSAAYLERIERSLLGVEAHVVSALTGAGLETLAPYLGPGQTVAVVGSSGVGKSTLVNALLGETRMLVRDIRERDQRGQHTTTHRAMLPLPSGALLMDTPGIRTLLLLAEEGGLSTTFSDLEAYATDCRFRNCEHQGEPGCAVEAAVEAGQLEAKRLKSYHKLQRELRWQEGRQNERVKQLGQQQTRTLNRAYRAMKKQLRG